MMHRSALVGTTGVLVLAVVGHVILSALTPGRQAVAESNAPSRFTAPDSTVPLQPMPARMGAVDESWQEGEMQLTSGQASSSSRRRAAVSAAAPPTATPSPAPKATQSLPSSLDEALNRFRENPAKVAPKDSPQQATAPADDVLEPPASTPAPSSSAPATTTPTQAAPTVPGARPSAGAFRYQPAPSANGPAQIGQGDSAPAASARATPVSPQVERVAEVPSRPQPTLPAASTPPTASGALIDLQSPAVVVETQGPQSLVLGKVATYRIHARNVGNSSARQMRVRLQVPPGVELRDLRGSLGTPQRGEQEVMWDIPVLPAGSQGSLELDLVASNTRPFELAVEVATSSLQGAAPIAVLQPMLEMTIAGPDDILFGDSQIFQVIAKNTGTGPAENVSMTIMPIKQGQNPTVIDSIGTIGPGEQKVIELELTAKQAGTLQLRAETRADNGLHARAGHDVMIRRAELAVSGSGPAIKYAATSATYELSVANTGNAPATGIGVRAHLPTGAKFVSASEGGRYDESTQSVVWNMAELEAGGTRQLQVVSTLMVDGNNIVQVTAEADQGLSGKHELLTRVESVADLKLLVNDPPGPIPVGQEVEYEFTLNNRGTKHARDVQVSVSFGNGIEPLSVAGGKGTIQGDQVKFDAIPTVDAGGQMVLKVKARGRSEGNHTYRAEVHCDSPSTRLAIEESTHFYGTAIRTASPQIGASRPEAEPAPLSPAPFSRYR